MTHAHVQRAPSFAAPQMTYLRRLHPQRNGLAERRLGEKSQWHDAHSPGVIN